MSLWSRMRNVFRGERLSREIEEELQTHIAEAVERGRDPGEAARAFGPPLQLRERSRDIRLVGWLDSLRADAVFGWRQLLKRKVTSAAAIVSLGLATGACTAAFRLVDALLWRPLPVASPERLYSVAFENTGADGKLQVYDSSSYPLFQQMQAAVQRQAELVAVSYADRADLTYGSDQDMERAYRQYVSGRMFSVFGLQPAAGRLLNDGDDGAPGTGDVAVLSHDYWTRRFGGDRRAIGRTFHMGDAVFEIVGVAPEAFTGTETGTMTDVFLPMSAKLPRTLASFNNFWLRALVQVRPGIGPEPLREQLRGIYHGVQEERMKKLPALTSAQRSEFFQEKLLLEPAGAGRSNLQRDYRRPLDILGVLVALVLLIACANVANLMTARAAARAREMALRVSIGAGRARLIQLVLVESAWISLLSSVLGGWFAWWLAPLVVRMVNPADNPARLALPADWRVLAFGLALAAAVTALFGLMPALRASGVKPSLAMKGGEDPHSRHRVMYTLIAVQVAFCFVVYLAAGLFVRTLDHLQNRPLGFSAARILNLDAVSQRPQPQNLWKQVLQRLRATAGVEEAAIVAWPLLSGESAAGSISVNGAEPGVIPSDFLNVSPGWLTTMRIPLLDGRDFRDTDANPGSAIVNETFAKQFFGGEDPVGRTFERVGPNGTRTPYLVVGLAGDARSRDNLRLPIRAMAYTPLETLSGRGTFVVRTSTANPMAMAAMLRRKIPGARPEFRVNNIRTQEEVDLGTTVRERLLATLARFFAAVALLLGGIGLYGVLDYSVVERRQEIGIRMAIGARPGHIARRVTADALLVIFLGVCAGAALGFAALRGVQALLFDVKATDPLQLAAPACAILAAALAAAAPAIIRAVKIDPVKMLRAE